MPLLQKGAIVGQYIVTRKLGEGQFAEVWEVRLNSNAGTPDRFALKLEKRKERNTVKQEYKVLKRLQGACSQVVAVTDSGTHEGHFYMVMQLLGETLFDARKLAGGRLDVPTVKAIGLSTLAAIEQLHQQSMIHRDIKPANFVIHPLNAAASKGTWLLIDFGLVRRFTDDSGQHLQQRSDAAFRGSTTYASIHAHKAEDLSRRDDLWSWLYMLVELLDGSLPWRQEQHAGEQHAHVDKHWVQQQKELCIQEPHRLTQSIELPEPLADVSRYLARLGFSDAPDYQHLRQLLQQLPDQQQRLHSLTEPGRLLDDKQQSWDWARSQRVQQQQWGDTGWQPQAQLQAEAAGTQNGQQQQQQAALTPKSPPEERLSPLAFAQIATAGKRPPSIADSDNQLAKRKRVDSSKPRTQDRQQLQNRQGTAAVPSPADEGSTDSRPSSSQGRAGAQPPHRQAMQRPLSRRGCQRSRSRSRERQLERAADGVRLRQGQSIGDRELDAGHLGAAAGQTMQVSIKNREPSAGAIEQAPASSAGGEAAEIEDLVAVFTSEAAVSSRTAVQQTVEAMLSLAPVDAVAAMAITVRSVSERTDAATAPAVAKLLADLAAFVSSGSAKARRSIKG